MSGGDALAAILGSEWLARIVDEGWCILERV